MKDRLIAVLGLLLISQMGIAQIPNDFGYHDYKKRFPKESFIILDISTEDIFDITKEGISVESSNKEKILYLNNNAYAMSQRGLYFNQFSELLDISAVSFNADKGKYKKEKVKEFTDEQVISTDISFYDDSWNKKFKFENLREGSVSELTYKRKIKDHHLIHQRSFSKGIFKNKETRTFRVHQDIELGFKLFNMDDDQIKYTESKDGKYKVYTWEIKNWDQENIYGNTDYDMYYTPHIVPFIKSYTLDGEKVKVFENLDGLYAWYYSLVKKVNPTEKKELKHLADSLTEGITSEVEKVKKIYYWVQNEIKYIAFGDGYGGFVPRDPDLIYERRFGDCKDMSCLTVNLLKELDITAHFTWVGTRQIPYGYTQLFTPQVDNHMIATYFGEDGKIYFLDATNSDLEFGRPSSFIQGKEVLISIDKENYKVENVPFVSSSENTEIDSTYITIDGDKLKGTGVAVYTGFWASEVYQSFKGADEKQLINKFKARLSKGSNKFIVENIKFDKVSDSRDTVKVTYDFEIDSYLNYVGDNAYLDLNLSKGLKEWKFDKKINIPVILDYKWELNKVFVLELPKDYELEYIPEAKNFSDQFMDYQIEYIQQEDKLIYKLRFVSKSTKIEVDELEDWNKSIKKLSAELEESLKLKKK